MAKNSKYPTLDLHGKTTDQVFDLIDKFLTKNQHKKKVGIMPGKGSGALMKEAKKYLKMGGYPWSHEVLPTGAQNLGKLIVHLD